VSLLPFLFAAIALDKSTSPLHPTQNFFYQFSNKKEIIALKTRYMQNKVGKNQNANKISPPTFCQTETKRVK
jgi:hypothetical protein